MIKKVEHTAIIVKNMEESIQYYREMFGFILRVSGKNERREMAFLYHPNQKSFEIELIRDLLPQDPYSERGIVNHLAFTVEDIKEAITYYGNKGVQFHSEQINTAIDGAKTIFFSGPNGELLQLVEPMRPAE